ncbi:HU family DNA-binding protein [Cellulomonas sp. PhB150]|uniref:HU family DNA-binding protein n=1 Tax=Cellulomonas sp. PhB150 TaxID=2485188 RepID=UPI000F492C95|nr:HU family DNA-binding protein [Cellulomonas sp. PhB150]ROS31162.1 DNA-binding protein HU-beta [Cellulomonas sp. PhB150]
MPGKSQIADRIAARGWSRQAAGTAVDAVLDEITAALAAGERVTLTGFGTFEPAARAARSARNPRTGASIDVAATTVARFHPGATLRSRVASGSPVALGELAAAPASPVLAAGSASRTSHGQHEDTTETIHRAKGADKVKVKPARTTGKAAAKAKAAAEKAAKAEAAKRKAADKAAKVKAAEKAAKAKSSAKKKAAATTKAKSAKGKKK